MSPGVLKLRSQGSIWEMCGARQVDPPTCIRPVLPYPRKALHDATPCPVASHSLYAHAWITTFAAPESPSALTNPALPYLPSTDAGLVTPSTDAVSCQH
eukprot:gene7697-1376_t